MPDQNQYLPSTDLALERQFEASSTCGQLEPAQYCYSESNGLLVSTDNCYICDASSPQTSRGFENLNDGDLEDQLQSGDGSNLTNETLTEPRTWWQSADLDSETEVVTIELKFEREFEVFQVAVDFRSLRPASGSLEVSTDFGRSYKPVQYYSNKCLEDFGVDSDESVVNGEAGCTSNYTDPSPGPVRCDSHSKMHTLQLTLKMVSFLTIIMIASTCTSQAQLII